jgi:hypothetical protein
MRRMPLAPGHRGGALVQVAPADLDVPVLGLAAPLRSGPLRQEPLEHAPRDPDHATALAYLASKFRGPAIA